MTTTPRFPADVRDAPSGNADVAGTGRSPVSGRYGTATGPDTDTLRVGPKGRGWRSVVGHSMPSNGIDGIAVPAA